MRHQGDRQPIEGVSPGEGAAAPGSLRPGSGPAGLLGEQPLVFASPGLQVPGRCRSPAGAPAETISAWQIEQAHGTGKRRNERDGRCRRQLTRVATHEGFLRFRTRISTSDRVATPEGERDRWEERSSPRESEPEATRAPPGRAARSPAELKAARRRVGLLPARAPCSPHPRAGFRHETALSCISQPAGCRAGTACSERAGGGQGESEPARKAAHARLARRIRLGLEFARTLAPMIPGPAAHFKQRARRAPAIGDGRGPPGRF
jgi:hypothetical protein